VPHAATYVAQATPGSAGRQDVIRLTATLNDCPDHSSVKLVLEPGCVLCGTWSEIAGEHNGFGGGWWHAGTVILAAGQTCSLALGTGRADLSTSTGVVKVSDSRVAEVSLAGAIVGGNDAGRVVAFSFTAAPAGPVPTSCQ